jgi:hypothetical protein
MQGIKVIGGHSYFHLASFIAMIWLKMEYGDEEIEVVKGDIDSLVSSSELFVHSSQISLMEIDGMSTNGVSQVCADHEMASQVLKAIYQVLMWSHLAQFLLHMLSQWSKSCNMHNLA